MINKLRETKEYRDRETISGASAPNNWDLMNKINEIIDHINGMQPDLEAKVMPDTGPMVEHPVKGMHES